MPNIGSNQEEVNSKIADRLRDEDQEIKEFEGDILEPKDPKVEEVKNEIVKTAMESGEKEVAKRTRSKKQAPKTVPSSQLIEKLEGQIAAIKYIETVQVPDIPQLPVKAREILISMVQQMEKIKVQALADIQSI